MTHSARSSSRPAIARLWTAETVSARATRAVVLVAFGSALLAVSSKVSIPFWPVPATLTSLVVVLIGAFYGARLGAATLAAYLLEGLAGLPVFAGTPEKGIGLVYAMGPTGGYLLGYLAAAIIAGWLIERGWGKSILATAVAALLANIALYALGVAWLAHLIGIEKAVTFGVLPFLAADAIKIAIATAVVAASRPRT